MSQTLYNEAIAEAKLLKDTAEQNAKNAIIEAVTPKIRSFIEEQLLGGTPSVDDSDLLQEIASGVVSDDLGNDVALDESALMSLLEIFGGKNISSPSSRNVVSDAMRESFNSLTYKNKKKLLQVANKLNQNIDLFEDHVIHNDVYVQQENSRMSKSKDVLYEVDLDELASMASAMMAEEEELELEGDYGGNKGDESRSRRDYAEAEEEVEPMDEEGGPESDEDEKLDEIMSILGLGYLNEDKIEIDLGDAELPEDVQLAARLVLDDEEEGDVEVEEEEDIEVDEDMPLPGEEEEEVEMEDLDEVFDIDPNVLRSEIRKLRRNIAEAKDFTKMKGIKNDMAHSWGGKGNSKAGVKGAYGGSGTGKSGVIGAYGGGKASGDPLKVTLNKLSEAIKNERRKNRTLGKKLGQYRSAVETLREQLTDLNLFNAKLLYVNKLLQNKDVSSSQRRTVVESIDNAKSLREVKLVYRTLTESFTKGNSGVLRESATRRTLGSSSRVAGRSSSDSASAEVNRWAVLAGIKE